MKGSYRVVIQNKDIKYDFTVNRNITIIKGNSATGKTTLVSFIEEFYEDGEASGIQLQCEKVCNVLSGRNWQVILDSFHDSIVFIDEGNKFVHSREFARAIQSTDNYYVIITRENLVNLPYSVTEIYGIREAGKYAGIKQVYNEFYRIYAGYDIVLKNEISTVLVEDSNSGFQFFKGAFDKYNVVSAEGKSNVFSKLNSLPSDEVVLVIADGAAFGAEIDKIMRLIVERKAIALYLPESFEWIILKSDIFHTVEIKNIMDEPGDKIESKEYFSWERYFTDLLVKKTNGTYLQYSKSKLNEVYLQRNERDKILSVIYPVKMKE